MLLIYGNLKQTKGDFSNAVIYLDNNNLSRFEASVFESIYLQNLPVDKKGSVFLQDSKYFIKCLIVISTMKSINSRWVVL